MDSHSPSNRFEAVNEILATALGLLPEERRPYVESCCGADSALQDSVIRLLDKFDNRILECASAAGLDYIRERRQGSVAAGPI
jgi:hypothetical protein